MEERNDPPEILDYVSRKQVQPSHESANRLLLLYSIPSTALFLLIIELFRPMVMPPRLISPESVLLFVLLLSPIALVFGIASFNLGKERGAGFALWYSMLMNVAAIILILVATLCSLITWAR
jgi:hypothetical protein